MKVSTLSSFLCVAGLSGLLAGCELEYELLGTPSDEGRVERAEEEEGAEGEGEVADEGACEPGRDICEDAYQGCLADGQDEGMCEEDFQLCVADSEWPDDGHAPCGEVADEGACEPGRDICEDAYQGCLADGHDEGMCEEDFQLCVADSEWPDDGHAPCAPGRRVCEDAYQGCLADGNDPVDCEVDFDLCVADSEWPEDDHDEAN